MKVPLLRTIFLFHSTRLRSFFLTLHPFAPFHLRKLFSSASAQKSGWNSNANLHITNPTLLIMESCNSMSQLKQVQAHMTRTGLIFHFFPVSRVLSFCAIANDGDIRHARVLFAQISEPNVYMWNTMIRGYCKARNPEMGLSFFRRMVYQCVEMDKRSFVFGLKACELLRTSELGCSIHCMIWKSGFIFDLIVRNGLIHFYAYHGCLNHASKVFDETCLRDVVSWTALIDGYAKSDMPDEALRLFHSMSSNGVKPNDVTMIAVFSACSRKKDLRLGKFLHEYVDRNNVNCSLNLTNAILDLYVKCGCLDDAKRIFDRLETKDVFSWTSLINGYAKNGELDLARKYFDEMPERNVVSWNAMIAGYSQNNRPNEALGLFYDMVRHGLFPVEGTLVCVLSACAQCGCFDLGKWIHHHYVKEERIHLSVSMANALIDMYAKCGCISAAVEVFSEMPEKDLVSWNSMIVGYASHGHAEKALVLFEQMTKAGFKPDDITFVGVLSACSHGGLVHQGWEFFKNMERNFGVKQRIEHYACMIDLLGRVGLLEEAYNLINKMPIESDVAIWGALLNACKMHGNVEMGKLAAEKLILMDPEDSGIYVLLASLCANKSNWGDVRTVRSLMRDKGVKKTPGCSLIEVDGEFHEFLVADESHPKSLDIYRVLNEISLLSKLEDPSSDVTQLMYSS